MDEKLEERPRELMGATRGPSREEMNLMSALKSLKLNHENRQNMDGMKGFITRAPALPQELKTKQGG